MTPEEQARVAASLPGEVTDAEMSPPEGDQHFWSKVEAADALKGYFGREGRRAYVACELPVYYPAERRFAPDLLVVMDAASHRRNKWVVSAEGKGLDFVLEVHVGGDRKKDAERNVARYARLGIPEYFIYDGGRQTLVGYRQPRPGARKYVPILPTEGRFVSERLGLELQVERGRLRFSVNNTQLPESAELADEFKKQSEMLRRRASSRARDLKKEAQRREEAERKLEEAERQLRKVQAELAQLKRRTSRSATPRK